jgi:dihydroorotate dehydrogenase
VIERLVISAPFGNYFGCPHAISTLGTFTPEFRAGRLKRLWRVLLTVRYYPGIGAWKNRLGLPNPGINWLSGHVGCGRIDASDKIVSVSARETSGWAYLLGACFHLVRPAYVELNVSCPSCPGEPDRSDYREVFAGAARSFPGRVIVKLPPVGYLPIAGEALACGVTGFHCCNTLPTPGGGLSGAPLKLLSLQAVREVRRLADTSGRALDVLIGGGGVAGTDDARDYLRAGASSVAVASVLFWPWRRVSVRQLADALADGSFPAPRFPVPVDNHAP